ncbi:MAG: hypothetical protein EZS28_005759 [Streblomastix strix]|uniref:Right handed beta helix domain-containing protein n=1 Tax=Streblomastix strix TaxID=222440 RepID=A0A5J4WV95_9EUKA|nr:MAG: hypothetical protein EZS28_005759 [Streblomastix strix]
MEGDYTFLNCLCNSYGGGMYLTTYQQVPIQINCTCMFQNCTSKSGGGMFISNIGSGDLTQLRGNFTFENCSAQLFGGGLFIESSNNGIIEIDDFIFIDCQSAHGGASIYGGGLYISFPSNSTLVLDKLCEFNKCVSQGCGGAIYANINYSLPFQFNISDTLIQQCTAKEDTTSTSPTGYGGGIFLTGSGDYDPSTENLDFRGMNINGNVAENGGQSLYVVMPNIIQWCKSGVAGEYIKGNYSDKYSDFEDIEGISADQITFNSLSLESVQQQQAPLQQYWVYISILTKVTATLNISDTNPLLINLEGYNMIEGQFTVKIVELGQINDGSSEFIHIEGDPQNDGSTEPILVKGDPQSQQTASFGMKDISCTPLFQIHEPYPQYIDPPLHWEQQNQLQGSEKDFDPPLKKDPPIYPEVEQSHNISNEEQQTIIDWDSFKKINIPSFKYRNKKK